MYRRARGYTLIELLVITFIVAILALVALPRLLGGREKARAGACQAALTELAGELANRMDELQAAGSANPAQGAINATLARVPDEKYTNPRNRAELGFQAAPSSSFTPNSSTSCIVYFVDATASSPGNAPSVLSLQYEGQVRTYRVTLG